MKPPKKSIIIPAILLVYLAVMAVIAWPGYRAGELPAWQYYGTIALTLAIVIALHFIIKKRARLRQKDK